MTQFIRPPRELSPEGCEGGLVLRRHVNEFICIGYPHEGRPRVLVQVGAIEGNRVALRIEAASDIAIHRPEVWKRAMKGDER